MGQRAPTPPAHLGICPRSRPIAPHPKAGILLSKLWCSVPDLKPLQTPRVPRKQSTAGLPSWARPHSVSAPRIKWMNGQLKEAHSGFDAWLQNSYVQAGGILSPRQPRTYFIQEFLIYGHLFKTANLFGRPS